MSTQWYLRPSPLHHQCCASSYRQRSRRARAGKKLGVFGGGGGGKKNIEVVEYITSNETTFNDYLKMTL